MLVFRVFSVNVRKSFFLHFKLAAVYSRLQVNGT